MNCQWSMRLYHSSEASEASEEGEDGEDGRGVEINVALLSNDNQRKRLDGVMAPSSPKLNLVRWIFYTDDLKEEGQKKPCSCDW